MRQHQSSFTVSTRRGLTDITGPVREALAASGLRQGLCTVYIRHTSASLVIQENADPAVQRDLETFLGRLAPDGDPRHTHVAEGDDDMPSHIKAALTRTSEQIPFDDGALRLGTWQGIYLWEHRTAPHRREIVVHLAGT